MATVCRIAGVKKDDFLSRYSTLLKRGLSNGVYEDGKVCIEAAVDICMHRPEVDVKDLEKLDDANNAGSFGDGPTCVKSFVRELKIALNDECWQSEEGRAAGLWSVGIAQLGSNQLKLTKAQFNTLLLIELKKVFVPTILKDAQDTFIKGLTMPATLDALVDMLAAQNYDASSYTNIRDTLTTDRILLDCSDDYGGVFAQLSGDGLEEARDRWHFLYADAITAALVAAKSPGVKWLKVIPMPKWVRKERKKNGLK